MTISSAPSKSKTIESKPDTTIDEVSIVKLRTSAEPETTSSTLITALLLPSPMEPRSSMLVAFGAFTTILSSPAVPAPVKTTVKSTEPAISLVAMLLTTTTCASDALLAFPSTPPREKVAPPEEFSVITTEPAAVPLKLISPDDSETMNVAA